MIIRNGKIMTPDEINAENFGVMKVTVVVPEKPAPEFGPSPVEGVSDEEFTQTTKQYLDDLTAQGWELVREEAEEKLRSNPHDEQAKTDLLKYAHFKKHEPGGLKLVKTGGRKLEPSQRRIGNWVNTKGHGWVVKMPRHLDCQAREVVEVRKKGGTVAKVKLLAEVERGSNHFRARDLEWD